MYHSLESGLFYIMELPFVLLYCIAYFLYCKTYLSIKRHLDFKKNWEKILLYLQTIKCTLIWSMFWRIWCSILYDLRFSQPLAVRSSIFWDITLSGRLKVDQHFGGTCCLHLRGRRINKVIKQHEADLASWVAFQCTAWHYISEDRIAYFQFKITVF
jgi:hypothetical protein